MANDKDFIVKNNARVRGGKIWLKDTTTDADPANQQHVYIDGSDGNLTIASDNLIEFHESDSPTRRVVFDCNDNKYSFGDSTAHGTTDTQGEMFHVAGSGRFGSTLNVDGGIYGRQSSVGSATADSGNSHSFLNNVFLNPSPEAGGAIDIRTVNELAGLNTWGTISAVSGFYITRTDATANDGDATNPSYTYSNQVTSITTGNMFDGVASTAGSWYTDNGTDGTTAGTGTFTLSFAGKKELDYTCYVGIVFGSTNFTPKRVKIEVYRGGTYTNDAYSGGNWETLCDLTNNTAINVSRKGTVQSSVGIQQIRYTLGAVNTTSSGYFRVQDVYALDHDAGGNDGPKGIHYVRRYGDSNIYGNILPAIDSTYTLGDSDQFFLGVYSDKLYLNSTATTSSTSKAFLCLDGTEVKKRTLGLNAFNSTNFLTADANDTTNAKLTLNGTNPHPLEIIRTSAANSGILFQNTATGGENAGNAHHTAYLGLGTADGEINIGTAADVQGTGNRITTVADKLNVFASTTSAELAGKISDETGSGALVFATSPTLVTPALGTPASGDLQNCTFPDSLAPKTFISSDLSVGTYKRVARVTGNQLGSIIRASFSGTTGNVVVAVVADIIVNHSGDIHIMSQSGDYHPITIKVFSNDPTPDADLGDEDFDLYVKYAQNDAGNAGATMTLKTTILSLGDETVTANPTNTAYSSGTSHEHTTTDGGVNFTQSSGNVDIVTDGNVTADRFRGKGAVHYVEGDANDSAGVWTGTNTDITGLTDGLVVVYRHQVNGVSTGTTLNINGYGAKAVKTHNTTNLTTHFPAKRAIMYVYDSSDDVWFVVTDVDSVNDYELRWSSHITAGALLHGRQLLMEGSDGKFYPVTSGGANANSNTVSTQTMRMGGLILLYESSTDRAADAVFASSDLYTGRETNNLEYWTNHPISAGAWATQGGPLYLVGTEDTNGHFVLDSTNATSFLSQTLPNSDDGKIYVHLGYFGDTVDNLRFTVNNPAYQYINGQVQPYTAVPRKVTVTDNEDTAEENLITFVAGAATATGDHGLEMDGDFTYNPSSGTVTATNFAGTASLVNITDNNEENVTHYLTFVDGATGSQALETEGKLFFNPSTGTLNTTKLHLQNAVSNGPRLFMELSAANPANNDVIGGLDFIAKNTDGSGALNYASVEGAILDETAGSIDGKLLFRVAKDNSTTFTPLILTGAVATFGTGITAGDSSFGDIASGDITLSKTDSNNNITPNLNIKRVGNPTGDFKNLGGINFIGDNSANESTTYGVIYGWVEDDTNGTEDGRVYVGTMKNGTMNNNSLTIDDDGITLDNRITFDGSAATSNNTSSYEFAIKDQASDHSVLRAGNNLQISAYGYRVYEKDGSTNGSVALGITTDGLTFAHVDHLRGDSSSDYRIDLRSSGSSSILPGALMIGRSGPNQCEILPFADGNGLVGKNTKKWNSAHINSIYVYDKLIIKDNEFLRFGDGSGGDVNMFYDATNNHLEMEMESASVLFKITDNADSRFTFIKSSGEFTASGNITAFSDQRLKSEIKTLDPSKTLQMRGVEFIKDGKKGSGVIAQELEKVAPELVLDNDSGYKSVAYGNLTGYLIETVKEQQKQIDELKELVQKLLEK